MVKYYIIVGVLGCLIAGILSAHLPGETANIGIAGAIILFALIAFS